MIMYGKSNVGKQRQTNQDNFIIHQLDDNCGYVIVCDGMGGHSGGNIASELAIRTLDNLLHTSYEESARKRNIENVLKNAIRQTNGTIFSASLQDEALKGMGTTVVLAYYVDNQIYVANVGDSRAYYFDGEKIEQVTKDHSLVQEMLDRNELTPEQAKTYPYKHVITRVLGVTSDVETDIKVMEFSDEDVIMLCSDGLTNMIQDEQLEEILSEVPYDEACDDLINKANENGGQDNITVVLFCGNNAQ